MTTPDRVRVGRGSWPSDGRGGTVNATGNGFGPYYGIGAGERAPEGSTPEDIEAVRAGVKAIQRALNWHVAVSGEKTPAIPADGRFTEATRAAVIAFQQRKQPTINRDMYLPAVERSPSGLVHKETAYALFMPIADRYALKYTVPRGLLRGITTIESNWDPGAVGYWTNSDFGLNQWNTTLPDITRDKALDPYWALDSTAHAMRDRIDSDRWGKNWVYVIAAHNVPTWAAEWAQGKLSAANPDDKPKLDRMTGYVTNVLARVW
ncbi:peptidoglycan-binding protein [Frankia sp. CNm7]|uniref:Peptidoglycan-binding protein n=1 Tax=Frankia nepalensis TaxID=1836974 RepID=A0A937UNP6_9ACTN|nr:peptidoglycan-binding protein [Frankia nepalensis]MBL7495604.1 peptidoglycan-binding protein [Frankia nepalensis]MBL7508850.1 peptidoglycan-binding protein [Frankia nepalensis]MBL7523235.1 peptidoglycan-binding protein [Frankia nepalensis]MBL7630074.1 peptidoglycan-binding protein [Frankia nepalensis]